MITDYIFPILVFSNFFKIDEDLEYFCDLAAVLAVCEWQVVCCTHQDEWMQLPLNVFHGNLRLSFRIS